MIVIRRGFMIKVELMLFGAFLLMVIILDIIMLISLIKLGDERKKLIIWKASTYTLLGTVGTFVIYIIKNVIRGYEEGMNPFTTLGSTAIIYCMLLLFFKKKYGG